MKIVTFLNMYFVHTSTNLDQNSFGFKKKTIRARSHFLEIGGCFHKYLNLFL